MNTSSGGGSSAERILVVEDLAAQAELARIFLSGLGYEVRIAATGAAALETIGHWQPDGLLLDIELPDFSGLELLARLKQGGSDAVVVVVTASASMELAKQAIRAGAEDFVVKPYNKDRLSVTLRNALQRRTLARSRQVLETQLTRTEARLQSVEAKLTRKGFVGFIGGSEPMRAIYDILQSVARSKASVFITGESGTGKELAAEALHKASPRANAQFVALNCGAIPRDLLESEVFGHMKGAFTGATADRVGAAKLADGGTLFLDEIGEMPLDMQVKLLRFVQTGTFSPVGSSKLTQVDVRFVCATNRDPMLEVQAGRFREDLYYRLYVVPVELPPLRERGDDVVLIARHFLTQFSREENRRFRGFSPETEAMLMAYPWPGNVRQLQNVVRNIVVLHDGEQVTPEMIPPPVNRPSWQDNRAAVPVRLPVQEPEPVIEAAAARTVSGGMLSSGLEPVVARPGLGLAARSPVDLAEPLTAAAFAEPVYPRAEPVQPMAETVRPAGAGAYAAETASHGATLVHQADYGSPPLRASETPKTGAAEIEVMPLAVMERRLVMAALAKTDGDIPRAAALLEINPSTVYRKVSAWKKEGLVP